MRFVSTALITGVCALVACAGSPPEARTLHSEPLDSIDPVISRSLVTFDPAQSADGKGSLRIDATQPTTVRLVETGDVDVENAMLTYSAKLRTNDVKGRVYLEMWAVLPGKGEFFSRALQQPLTGSTDWTLQQTPFLLEAGQNPENFRLNLVIDGTGVVWIDDLELSAAS